MSVHYLVVFNRHLQYLNISFIVYIYMYSLLDAIYCQNKLLGCHCHCRSTSNPLVVS